MNARDQNGRNSRSRGGGWGRGRGGGWGRGRSGGWGRSRGKFGGGGHPAGLSGKDIGLWYARHGKERKEKKDIENRSVVTFNKEHEENISCLLKNTENDVGSSSQTEFYSSDPHPKNFGNRNFDYTSNMDSDKFNYSQKCQCTLKLDMSFEKQTCFDFQNHKKNWKYQSMQEFRKKLPSYKMRDKLLALISDNQVIVVSGETGCGKTTQVAQFILDDYIEKQMASTCHVVCTQPRRISAVSVADRVASERGESCGLSCGYQIRLESKLPRDRGSILYCTTGILLQRLVNDPYLSNVSHIILDEIHERDLFSDFLLIIIKDLLFCRTDLKVVLMSATLNAEMFSNYFSNCPMIHIPGFTYPVAEYFLEDLIEMSKYRTQSTNNYQPRFRHGKKQEYLKLLEEQKCYKEYLNSISDNYSADTLQCLHEMNFEQIDNDLVIHLLKYISLNFDDGAVLIFLPGWDQISSLHDKLQKNPVFNSKNFLIIPLHSLMPTTNQREVFDHPPPGVRKIIIATNIAETSITIDDVVFVIDGGKSKEKTYDVKANISCLKPVWVSKASAKQRKGRAGRVKEGVCFHLFTRYHHGQFQEYQLAEMLRTPLDSLCLQIKILRLGKIMNFIVKALEPPDRRTVENAIHSLQQMGALDNAEELTALGYHLARLPVAPKVGRMILFGSIFSCLDPILTVAASLDFKDPFHVPIHKEKEADRKKVELSKHSKSDHIMLINAFKGWQEARFHGNEGRFCWQNFLSINTLKMINNMKKQFAHYLYSVGFLANSNLQDEKHNMESGNINLIKAVICAGLYPNVAKIQPATKGYSTRPPKLFTEHFGPVAIHPKSVNSDVKSFESQWLIYHEKMKTTKLYLYDTTMISPFPLLFFGGEISVHQENGLDTIQVDKGIKFHSPVKIAQLVKDLRHQLDVLLSKKIQNPSMQLAIGCMTESRDHRLLQAIIDLITSEKVQSKSEYENV